MTDDQKRAVLKRYQVYKERGLVGHVSSKEDLARRRKILVGAVKKWRTENEREGKP